MLITLPPPVQVSHDPLVLYHQSSTDTAPPDATTNKDNNNKDKSTQVVSSRKATKMLKQRRNIFKKCFAVSCYCVPSLRIALLE